VEKLIAQVEARNEPRVLVIGLDAATYDLIGPWADKGHLPTFASLMQSSAYGPLCSVPNVNSAAAWSSFATGKNPGKHGIFWFYERQADSYDIRFLNGSDNPEPRFWDLCSRTGRPIVVFNVPFSYPAYAVNGVIITGMQTPSESALGFTYPEALRGELKRLVPQYRIETDVVVLARSGRWDKAVRVVRDMVDARVRLAEHLIDTKPWDLFVVVFTVLDRVQHTFWRHMDPSQPGYDPELSPKYGDVILTFYRMMDDAIGRLVKRCDKETYLVLVSDHGMGHNQMGSFFLNPLLEEMGFFSPAKRASNWRSTGRSLLRWGIRRAAPRVEGWFPRRLRKAVMGFVPGGRAAVARELHQNECDWGATRVYTDYVRPELWVNLKGREPQGIVEPGDEYMQLCDEVIEMLQGCVDVETGKPIVRQVQRREEVYWGANISKAPDLIIDWNYDVVVKGVSCRTPTGKTITIREQDKIVERRDVSGDHRPEGIFLLYGPGVRAGYVTGQSILDVAPTVLHLAGLPVLQDMDGHVMVHVFEDDKLKVVGPRIAASELGDLGCWSTARSAEEERAVGERLKGLGYL
jgi:pentatricopeptide repeat protein